MEEPSQFCVGQTVQILTCSNMEKPHTGLDDCLNMLLACFIKRMSGSRDPIDFSNFVSPSVGVDSDAERFRTLGVALVRTPSYFFWSGMELSTEASFVCESPQGSVQQSRLSSQFVF